jgi:hypothetical protein
MGRVDRAVGAPKAASFPELPDIVTTLSRNSAEASVLRLERRSLAGSIGFPRFLISHRTIHPDRKSRHDEAKTRCPWPM